MIDWQDSCWNTRSALHPDEAKTDIVATELITIIVRISFLRKLPFSFMSVKDIIEERENEKDEYAWLYVDSGDMQGQTVSYRCKRGLWIYMRKKADRQEIICFDRLLQVE